MTDFEAREIVIAHQSLWEALERFADERNLMLTRIPFGCDDEGKLTMEVPEGRLAPYGFIPRDAGPSRL